MCVCVLYKAAAAGAREKAYGVYYTHEVYRQQRTSKATPARKDRLFRVCESLAVFFFVWPSSCSMVVLKLSFAKNNNKALHIVYLCIYINEKCDCMCIHVREFLSQFQYRGLYDYSGRFTGSGFF